MTLRVVPEGLAGAAAQAEAQSAGLGTARAAAGIAQVSVSYAAGDTAAVSNGPASDLA
ncbi:hypothetical protein LAUMK191_04865 [Mycobacterium attenuatum]|uniref:PE domain-containing protein n=1 Tax=Mycobacterium attenuatum TaxID=2341086 RepID=A0A498QCF9_9MYCO|nr:hypothetical protein LAUMK136_04879 [Mycobacterium attenuatum]VBA59137.1 hypothetical protein LAUMK191_04865 [Mycobacterium attenuatum]VBA61651.1 hypothetical protein LAUMK41_05033 [Mycobacterium attenuatum]